MLIKPKVLLSSLKLSAACLFSVDRQIAKLHVMIFAILKIPQGAGKDQ